MGIYVILLILNCEGTRTEKEFELIWNFPFVFNFNDLKVNVYLTILHLFWIHLKFLITVQNLSVLLFNSYTLQFYENQSIIKM